MAGPFYIKENIPSDRRHATGYYRMSPSNKEDGIFVRKDLVIPNIVCVVVIGTNEVWQRIDVWKDDLMIDEVDFGIMIEF